MVRSHILQIKDESTVLYSTNRNKRKTTIPNKTNTSTTTKGKAI